MAKTKVARRYAKALFDLALEKGRLDSVWDDLGSLHSIIQESVKLSHFLQDPLLPVERKSSIFSILLKDKLDTLSFQFVLFLVEKKRINLLQACCVSFDELYYDYKGILKVSIISAKELSAVQIDAINNNLKANFDKKIESSVVVNPSLLGGFKIIVGDQVLDFSLGTQLQRIKHNIINA